MARFSEKDFSDNEIKKPSRFNEKDFQNFQPNMNQSLIEKASHAIDPMNIGENLSSALGNLLLKSGKNIIGGADILRQTLQGTSEPPLNLGPDNFAEAIGRRQTPIDQYLTNQIQNKLGTAGSFAIPQLRSAELLSPVIGKSLSGVAGRNVPQIAYNAAISENPEETAKTTLGLQAAFGALPAAAKGLSAIKNTIVPQKLTDTIIKNIPYIYNKLKGVQQRSYDFAMNKYGNDPVNLPNLLSNPEIEPWLTPNIKKVLNDYRRNPNLNNAHAVKAQIFRDQNKISEGHDIVRYQRLNQAHNEVKNSILNHLSKDPEALASYQKGSDITRTQIAPFESSDYIKNIVEGKIKSKFVSPTKLKQELSKVYLNRSLDKDVMENHYLGKSYQELENKLSSSKNTTGLAGLLMGALIGGPLSGVGGAYLAKSLLPGLTEKFHMPEKLSMALKNYAPLATRTKNAYIEELTQRKNKK